MLFTLILEPLFNGWSLFWESGKTYHEFETKSRQKAIFALWKMSFFSWNKILILVVTSEKSRSDLWKIMPEPLNSVFWIRKFLIQIWIRGSVSRTPVNYGSSRMRILILTFSWFSWPIKKIFCQINTVDTVPLWKIYLFLRFPWSLQWYKLSVGRYLK